MELYTTSLIVNSISVEYMYKKAVVTLGLVVVFLLIVVGVLYDKMNNAQIIKPIIHEPIKIGFSTPLSGDAAAWGEPIKRGAEIALGEINSFGGVNGRRVEIIFEDDKCEAKEGAVIMNKFIFVDRVHAVTGQPCSSPALAMAPLANEHKMVLLTSGASSPKMADAGEYVFNIYPLDDLEFSYLAHRIDNQKIESVALLWINNDYGFGLQDVFELEYNGNILASETFLPDSTDFRTQLTKIKSINPEALVIISNPSESPQIVKQINELNVNIQLFANGPAIETSEFTHDSRLLAEGLIFAIPSLPDSEANKGFAEKYFEQFKEEAGWISPLGYDSIKLLTQAMEASGTNSDKVKNYLLDVKNYSGASGILSFDEKGNIQKPFTFKQIKNGEFVPLN